jgi:hypothetical protein
MGDFEKLAEEWDKVAEAQTDVTPENFGHETAALCCIDAVLSINRRYRAFVVPRLAQFRDNFRNVRTLADLRSLLDENDAEEVALKVMHYRDIARVFLLRRLVERLQEIVLEAGSGADESIALGKWARSVRVEDCKNFGVRGIGLATFQYIRMLFGADTAKPDVHLVRFVSRSLGRPARPLEVIRMIEMLAKRKSLSVTTVDHTIWQTESGAVTGGEHAITPGGRD